MPLLEQKDLNEKNLFKLLKKSVKKVIAENGIDPNTKKGNKELDFFLKKVARTPFSTLEQVQNQGEKIGYTIVEHSKERGKTFLDQGIIQSILLKGDIPLVTEASTVKTPITPKPKTQSQEVIVPPKPTTPVVAKSVTASPVAEIPVAEVEEEIEEEPIKPETKPSLIQEVTSMSLKDRIGEDIKTAMKAQDKIRLETVRSIKKVILDKEIAVRPSGQDSLTPEQEIEVLSQQAKQRRDSIEQFTNAGRDDLAEKEAQELAIIETYLPKQLTDEELTQIINEIIASAEATSVKDLGKVMGIAMKQLKGKADGKKIQELVKNQLS